MNAEPITTALDTLQKVREAVSAADDRKARHKAADLLLRRGFTSDHVRAATRFDPDD